VNANQPSLLPSPSTAAAPTAVQPNHVNTVATQASTISSKSLLKSTDDLVGCIAACSKPSRSANGAHLLISGYNPVAQPLATIQSLYFPSVVTAQPNYASTVAPQAVHSIQGSLPLQGLALNLQQQISSLQQPPAPIIQPQAPAPASTTVNSLLLNFLSQSLLGSSGSIAEQILAAGLLAAVSQAPPPPPPAQVPPAHSNSPTVDFGALLATLQQGTATPPAQALVQMGAVPTSVVSSTVVAPPAPVTQDSKSVCGQPRSSHRVYDERAKLLYVPTDDESVNAYQRKFIKILYCCGNQNVTSLINFCFSVCGYLQVSRDNRLNCLRQSKKTLMQEHRAETSPLF
jgi:hypothetical protein